MLELWSHRRRWGGSLGVGRQGGSLGSHLLLSQAKGGSAASDPPRRTDKQTNKQTDRQTDTSPQQKPHTHRNQRPKYATRHPRSDNSIFRMGTPRNRKSQIVIGKSWLG